MHAHSFPIDLKFRFSQLINDYIVEDKKLVLNWESFR